MTLVLAESDRLISPDDSVPVKPPSLRDAVGPLTVDLPEPPTEPGFVLTARALAEAHPRSPVALTRLGQAEMSAGNTDAALAAARAAARLAIKQEDASVGVGAAQILAALGMPTEANAVLEKLPDSPARTLLEARLALQAGAHEDAREFLLRSESVEALASRAWLALEAHEFRSAAHLLRAALKRTGPNPNLLVNLGCAYAALGELDRAINVTKQARHLDPSSQLVRLNLVRFLRSLGEFEDAADEIKELQELYPNDLDLVFIRADLLLSRDDPVRALKALTRARTSNIWISASNQERAELEANLAFVRWKLGKQTRDETFGELVSQLERTDYESLEIARLLPALTHDRNQVRTLEAVFEGLRNRHPDAALDWLRVRIELLSLDFETATKLAKDWALRDVFSASAAATAVFLLVEIAGDYTTAIEIGRDALKRNPGAHGLRNNVAYALALAGNLDEAEALLPPHSGNVHMTATRALISLLRGDIATGAAGYEEAYKLARDRNDDELAELVRYHDIVFRVRALRNERTGGRRAVLEFPPDWKDRPDLVLVARIAEREGVGIVVKSG